MAPLILTVQANFVLPRRDPEITTAIPSEKDKKNQDKKDYKNSFLDVMNKTKLNR